MPSDFIAKALFKLPPAFRVTIVLCGAVMIHLTIGTYHTFGNMLPYMASYMRNYTDQSVRIENLMWIPTFQGSFPLSMVIGGWVLYFCGPRLSTFFGCSIVTLGVALSAFTIKESFYLFFASYGMLFGFGNGIAYVSTVSMVINWAPDRIGLVSGIVAAGFGISSSIFAPIQTHFVNPHNLPATKEGYFLQKELLEKVPGLFLTLAIIYFVMQGIALIFVCDPPEKIRESGLGSLSDYLGALRGRSTHRYSNVAYRPVRTSEETKITAGTNNNVASLIRHRSASRDEGSDSGSDDDVFDSSSRTGIVDHPDAKSMSPMEMFMSPTFYALFAALFCCSFYANMFYNLYKTFAETFIEDDFFLAIAFSCGSVANAAARIGWGYLTDKTSFKITVSMAACTASALLLTMPLTKHIGKYGYLIWLLGMFICMGATHPLFITATVRCFGPRHKATNYGFLIFSTTLSGVLLAVISQFYLETIGYTYLFIGTAFFPFTTFLITIFIHKTPQGHLIS
ncbi:hypothetical protein WR25_02174 [Diploscapter pachys]|uniref:Major facilitator superfamily (MFS) profile domain-containing protein n=1 Tax=Diploscapter pachys TaxID=2018661 RepID=A0A2A2KQN3_9BILA|nr:hypothetical protein WR25_02174 [Diploscapter pachys]